MTTSFDTRKLVSRSYGLINWIFPQSYIGTNVSEERLEDTIHLSEVDELVPELTVVLPETVPPTEVALTATVTYVAKTKEHAPLVTFAL